MLSVAALAVAGAGGGRNMRASARTDSSSATSPGTQISTLSGQRSQTRPAPLPSSIAPAATRSNVVSNNNRRNAGASGSCGAGKEFMTRSATSDTKARAKTNAAAILALVPAACAVSPPPISEGHRKRTTSQISSVPAGRMNACPWRAANPGSSRDCCGCAAEAVSGSEYRNRADVNASVARSAVSANSNAVSTMALRPPETVSNATERACGSTPAGNKAAASTTATAAAEIPNSRARRRTKRCDRGKTGSVDCAESVSGIFMRLR